ncbi:MAG TPA: hypothetical protein VK905_00200, partial [Bacillota bacterium]|nr:hypothetical protein [Bacillota bacterium]
HTLPHLLTGHRHFEEYAEKTAVAHFCDPTLGPTGQDTVGRLARENSLFSAEFLPGLLKEGSSVYDMVLGHVVPQALYSTKRAFEIFVSCV